MTLAAGALILVGLVGIALPILPGLLLVWLGVLLWATQEHSTTGWVLFGVATALIALSTVVKYLVPGRRMRRAGVRTSTMLAGVVLGIIGFFVIPVVGLAIGFVLGVYLAERSHAPHRAAWESTKVAARAVALSIGIELLTGLVVAASWGITVWMNA